MKIVRKSDLYLIEKENVNDLGVICRYKRKGNLLFQAIVNKIAFNVDEVELLEGNTIRFFKNNIMVCQPICDFELYDDEIVLTI